MSENLEILQFEGFENSYAHRIQTGSLKKKKKSEERKPAERDRWALVTALGRALTFADRSCVFMKFAKIRYLAVIG